MLSKFLLENVGNGEMQGWSNWTRRGWLGHPILWKGRPCFWGQSRTSGWEYTAGGGGRCQGKDSYGLALPGA